MNEERKYSTPTHLLAMVTVRMKFCHIEKARCQNFGFCRSVIRGTRHPCNPKECHNLQESRVL